MPLSDRTGLKNKFDVDIDDKTYVVETVSNFNIDKSTFVNDTLAFQISSGLSNNLMELEIPQNITKGTIHFFLDKQEVFPKVMTNQKISFATLEFTGNGTHTLEIKSDFTTKINEIQQPSPENNIGTMGMTVIIIVVIGAIAVGGAIAYKKSKSK